MHLPWLPSENARLRNTAPPDACFALIEKRRGAFCIVALSRAAIALGLNPGLPLADARARVPDLAVMAFDPEGDAACLRQLALFCQNYTPSVSEDPPWGLILDITGCTHRFAEGEAGLRDDLLGRLADRNLTAQAACADTPDAARALARFGMADVQGLPVAALDMGGAVCTALRRAGFRRIGDLASLPRAPLAARFGPQLPVLLARLLGEEDRAITPIAIVEPVNASLRFAEPIGRAQDVLDAVEALIADMATELERRGEGARAFALWLERSDGHVTRLRVETGAPTRDAALVLRLLYERMESLADPLDPGFGYDRIGMRVLFAEPLGVDQASLLDEGLKERTPRSNRMGPLLDRLIVRNGAGSVRRFIHGNSHLPERAAFLGAREDMHLSPWLMPEVGEPPLRPLSLFNPPQRVDVLAAIPDGPPRRFRWRGHFHEVVRQEGPERIAPEWWLKRRGHDVNPGLTRDYYRVEDGEGRRFWLFRHGLYGVESSSPAWFLHGLFA